MPDTVIAHVNALGTDQPEQLIFTDQGRCLIRDVKIPGVMDFEKVHTHVCMHKMTTMLYCHYWIQ
jgi:hypothetical protein